MPARKVGLATQVFQFLDAHGWRQPPAYDIGPLGERRSHPLDLLTLADSRL